MSLKNKTEHHASWVYCSNSIDKKSSIGAYKINSDPKLLQCRIFIELASWHRSKSQNKTCWNEILLQCSFHHLWSDSINFHSSNDIECHTSAHICTARRSVQFKEKIYILAFFWVSSMRSFTCSSIRKLKIALSNSTMWNGIQLSFYLPHKINGMFFPLIVCNSTITKQATTRNIRAFPMIFVKRLSLETLLKIVFLK